MRGDIRYHENERGERYLRGIMCGLPVRAFEDGSFEADGWMWLVNKLLSFVLWVLWGPLAADVDSDAVAIMVHDDSYLTALWRWLTTDWANDDE